MRDNNFLYDHKTIIFDIYNIKYVWMKVPRPSTFFFFFNNNLDSSTKLPLDFVCYLFIHSFTHWKRWYLKIQTLNIVLILIDWLIPKKEVCLKTFILIVTYNLYWEIRSKVFVGCEGLLNDICRQLDVLFKMCQWILENLMLDEYHLPLTSHRRSEKDMTHAG